VEIIQKAQERLFSASRTKPDNIITLGYKRVRHPFNLRYPVYLIYTGLRGWQSQYSSFWYHERLREHNYHGSAGPGMGETVGKVK
jgi:hypothetical protein